jgi:diguanylate cyclase (GGDEF)-like protein
MFKPHRFRLALEPECSKVIGAATMSVEALSAKLPEILREVRYFNETVDYVVLFNDETAAASLSGNRPGWAKDLIDLLKTVAQESTIQQLDKRIADLVKRGNALMKERSVEGFIMEDDFRALVAAREDIFDTIAEASPARSGGFAAEVVNSYRRWADELVIHYYFAPDYADLSADHDKARDKLIRWLDDVPHSLREKVNIQHIIEADEDLFRTARVRMQERTAGRVPNDATFENIATIRERLLDQLIELQILVSEFSSTSDSPLVVGGRRRLEADLHAEMARFVRHEDQVFTLVICVIDKVKGMRDKLGNEAVDSVIRQAAATLIETLRPYDKVYSAGGGKLAMLLPNSRAQGGFEAARRCRRKLEETAFLLPSGRKVRLSASFGLSESRVGEDWQGLYDAAYQALTSAKSRGNNQCAALIEDSLKFDEVAPEGKQA